MYVTVRSGDKLPTVALAQARLLDRVGPSNDLVIDGVFGNATHTAVVSFQRTSHVACNGAVDQATWGALVKEKPLLVVDVIDATDITVLQEDGPFLNDGHSKVIVNYGTSRGARELIQRLSSVHASKSIALLRLHGHGSPGHMVVSGGKQSGNGTTFGGEHFTNPDAVAQYRLLGNIMKPYGSIELHGCRVAAKTNGQALLAGLAEAAGVPVTAGLRYQNGGRAAARFEGPTLTAFPGRQTLGAWSRRMFAQCEW